MSAAPDSCPHDAEDTSCSLAKWKKNKLAVAFGYCGAHYHGLQSNNDPEHPTIEDELVRALHAAGFISPDNMQGHTMNKISWQRASRTDKGVSALRNLFSAKLLCPPQGDGTSWVSRVNAFLPRCIRLYHMQPVTASFSSHRHCTGREYEYYLPTFCLLSPSELSILLPQEVAPSAPTKDMMDATTESFDETALQEPNATGDKRSRLSEAGSGPLPGGQDGEKFYMFRSIPRDTMARMRQHRVHPEVLHKARVLFQMFEGTRSFHNFTPCGNPSDPSTTRFMRKIQVSDPFVVVASRKTGELIPEDQVASCDPDDVLELEFVRVMLDGQSFMLNQIRKMIGAIITVLAADLDAGFLRSCLESSVVRAMPMAPANGLFLVNLFFDRYNHSLERIQTQGSNAVDRLPVNLRDVDPELVGMIRSEVLSSIVREELALDICGRWMRGIRFISRLAWSIDIS